MIKLSENISLKNKNTFGIDVRAKYFSYIHSIHDLTAFTADSTHRDLPRLFLGDGSNILFTRDFNGVVLQSGITDLNIIYEDIDSVEIKAGSGINWDYLVNWCVSQGFGGIENLSLIPGRVGAAPIQNIGAYGCEVKDTIKEVEVYFPDENEFKTFSNKECEFAYRNSVFKSKLKNKIFIGSVTFRLHKNPTLNTQYGSIEDELKNFNEKNIRSVRRAVINIRKSKLPDPEETGNGGSFFKNPVIPRTQADILLANYPGMPHYPADENQVKIPAGWLIEKDGWKGKRFGDAGVHEKQALVLVNYGNATGNEILELSQKITESVHRTFGIELEPEINIL